MDKLPITKAGELKISKQLHQLKTKDRVEISQAIADARAHGDLKENAEYHAAKEEQGFIEAKIQEIEHALANAQVIDVKDIPETGRVVFGSTIDLYDPPYPILPMSFPKRITCSSMALCSSLRLSFLATGWNPLPN